MANLLSIADQAWMQLYPNPGDEGGVSKEEFIATAKNEYAYQFWLKMKSDKREDGRFEIPGFLLSEKEMDVENNEINISELNALFTLENDLWIQDIGGFDCKCVYVRTTPNLMKTLCDDDSLPSIYKRYYTIRDRIRFPDGTHAAKLKILYANKGDNIDEHMEVEESLGGIVRRMLIDIYTGKIGRTDKTNNSNPDN